MSKGYSRVACARACLLIVVLLRVADSRVGAPTTENLNRQREAKKKLTEVAERELSEATRSASVSELETAMLNARESLPLFFCLIESHIFCVIWDAQNASASAQKSSRQRRTLYRP